MRPLISVIIPVYNAEEYIEECLDSVVMQDYHDYEVNLVDNGSDDRSIEICEKYARNHPDKINFVKLPQPTSIGRANHQGLKMMKGKYFLTIDSDDYISPGYFSELASAIKKHNPDSIMIDYECFAEEGIIPRYSNSLDEKIINESSNFEGAKYIANSHGFLPFVWRFVMRNPNLSDEDYENAEHGLLNSDAMATMYYLVSCKKIHYINKKFYNYRLRNNSLSTKIKDSKSVRDTIVTITRMIEVLNSDHIYQTTRNQKLEIMESFMVRYLKIFIGDFRLMGHKDLIEVSEYMDRKKFDFSVLKEAKSELLRNFAYFNMEFDSYSALKLFVENENSFVEKELGRRLGKDFYVIPTGAYGEGTAELLRKCGINLLGFLDNSSIKENSFIDGYKCHMPEKLKEANLDNINIIISSIYDVHVGNIKEQLMSIGLEEDQILIRR